MAGFRSPGLLFKVALFVALPAAVLAFVLGRAISATVDKGALAQARSQAVVVTRSLDESSLARAARERRASAATRRKVTALLRRLTANSDVLAARVLGDDRRVLFSSAPHERGGRLTSPELLTALGGAPSSLSSSPDGQETIDTFVPLRPRPGATPEGALQIEVAADPVKSAVAGDTWKLYALMIGGLLALCGVAVKVAGGFSAHGRRDSAPGEDRDALTGLPNRASFNAQLATALKACPAHENVAVLLMDLDRFKEINDSLGHFNGDLVIERVGKRLAAGLHAGELVARLGGDEFALMLRGVTDDDQVRGLVKRIHAALEEPFTAGGLALRVEASVGAALHRRDGTTPSNLLRAADVAMYAAKEARSGFELYSEDQRRYTPERLGLVAQLSRAMEAGELVLFYQPKARLDTGTVTGVEALVRWQHPQRGLLPPDEFIPVTEHTSMIRPVTIHLMEMALEQSRVWRSRGLDLSMAVNLSAQLLLDLGLPKEIGAMLSGRGTASNRLEVEITESAIAADPRRAQKILGALRSMGVGVAIDDFGTGFSSLTTLKQLPVTTLKVDKSFVMGMRSDPDDVAIVRSTVVLGRDLGLEVVTEGVEDQRTWDVLKDMGADIAQGYHLSKPLPPADFDRWLMAYRDLCPGGVRTSLPTQGPGAPAPAARLGANPRPTAV